MGHVFVSYSRRDAETVDRIADGLSGAGLELWIDRKDIQAGDPWRVQIVQAIDTCDAFVLVLSPDSISSENVCKEIDLAQDAGRKIFPVMLEPLKLPAEIRYQLAGLQFIDMQALGWEQAMLRLIHCIQEHAARLQSKEPQAVLQAELVIQGVDLKAFSAEAKEQLLNFVAQVSNANRAQLSIAGMAIGNAHVLVDMPARSAFELKTRALNRDKHFKKAHITSLRLKGDTKFIQIALGALTIAATISFVQALWLHTPPLLMPTLGVTAGKWLTISLTVCIATAAVLLVPTAVIPALAPPPTATALHTFEVSTQLIPLEPSPKGDALSKKYSGQGLPSTASPSLTETPFITLTPQYPQVLVDTLCWLGPGPAYEVVGSLMMGERVELTGRGCNGGWWIIQHPDLHTDCWMREEELQVPPGMNLSGLQTTCAPPQPTSTQRACTAATPFSLDPQCFCKFHPSDPYCYHYP